MIEIRFNQSYLETYFIEFRNFFSVAGSNLQVFVNRIEEYNFILFSKSGFSKELRNLSEKRKGIPPLFLIIKKDKVINKIKI